jgi:methyltransferase (TIGR00027 family)
MAIDYSLFIEALIEIIPSFIEIYIQNDKTIFTLNNEDFETIESVFKNWETNSLNQFQIMHNKKFVKLLGDHDNFIYKGIGSGLWLMGINVYLSGNPKINLKIIAKLKDIESPQVYGSSLRELVGKISDGANPINNKEEMKEYITQFISPKDSVDNKDSIYNKDSETKKIEGYDSEELDEGVSFTARILAHGRYRETLKETPLLNDVFAKDLAGDLTQYFKQHPQMERSGNYSIIRSNYIETKFIPEWLKNNPSSQIILLGAGLDSKVYRLKGLSRGSHIFFELDLPSIIEYKTPILQEFKPKCKLNRVSIDLSEENWFNELIRANYDKAAPSLWIMEGLLYYIPKNMAEKIIKKISQESHKDSKLFCDVCVPGMANLKFGPFTSYFHWGISQFEIEDFFKKLGWDIKWEFADKYDRGYDIGQKGLMFVSGTPQI